MKLLCFNENCQYVEQIKSDDLQDFDLNKPFIRCPECNSLAMLVKDDFDLNKIDENLLFSSFYKLLKRK